MNLKNKNKNKKTLKTNNKNAQNKQTNKQKHNWLSWFVGLGTQATERGLPHSGRAHQTARGHPKQTNLKQDSKSWN